MRVALSLSCIFNVHASDLPFHMGGPCSCSFWFCLPSCSYLGGFLFAWTSTFLDILHTMAPTKVMQEGLKEGLLLQLLKQKWAKRAGSKRLGSALRIALPSTGWRITENLKDFMSDAEMYGWGQNPGLPWFVWMNQIEQGHCT